MKNIRELIIRQKLRYDRQFMEKCLLLLHSLQEDDEQAAASTMHQNGQGFNKSDSHELTIYAEILIERKTNPEASLSQQTVREAHRRMEKYAGQLDKLIPDIDNF